MIYRYWISLVFLVGIFGCQTTGDPIGSGSVEMSPRVATAAARYFCNTDECEINMTRSTAIDNALKHCRKNANNRVCKIYAIGQDVVWKGPVTRRDSIWNPRNRSQNRLILRWQGFDTNGTLRMVAGIAEFSDDGVVASMDFQIQPKFMGKCNGEATFKPGEEGRWKLRCTKCQMSKVKSFSTRMIDLASERHWTRLIRKLPSSSCQGGYSRNIF